MKIYFASGNTNKRQEMARIFPDHQVVLPLDEGIDFDPEETADTFFGNAYIKAESLWELVRQPVLADDSGLCVDALGGAPGIRSARFGSENGKILNSSDRNTLLLAQASTEENRACRFVCNMVLFLGPDRFYSVQETLEGELLREPQGLGGFGYDPIVYVREYGKSVAELSADEKDRCSHRGKAGRAIACLLRGIPDKELYGRGRS